MVTSSSPKPSSCALPSAWQRFATRLKCVSITPLGSPCAARVRSTTMSLRGRWRHRAVVPVLHEIRKRAARPQHRRTRSGPRCRPPSRRFLPLSRKGGTVTRSRAPPSPRAAWPARRPVERNGGGDDGARGRSQHGETVSAGWAVDREDVALLEASASPGPAATRRTPSRSCRYVRAWTVRGPIHQAGLSRAGRGGAGLSR